MGQNESKQLIVCSFCKSEVVVLDGKDNGKTGNSFNSNLSAVSTPNNNNNNNNNNNEEKSAHCSPSMTIGLPSNTVLCPRCHGFYRKQIQNSNHKRRFSLFGNTDNHNNDNNNNNAIFPLRYIKHLHIAPFQDTLNAIEEKEISQEYIIDTYLKPYFNQNQQLQIQARNRIIIKNVEFKVFGCYPPRGSVNKATQFHLDDNEGRLITLRWRPIRQIHLLPTKASHSTYNKNKIRNHDNENENENDNNNNEELLISHLKPHLKENDDSYYIGDKSEKSDGRHLMEEETFCILGIEWRVMRCQPFDGFIDNRSTIYCHGQSIADCAKICIRPIYESLPNAHKNYTPTQIRLNYLEPFFHGRCRYIDHSREIKIGGVDFAIRDSLPCAGIITLSTHIDYNAAPVKAAELEEMQANEDMELARQLQQEENNILDRRSPFSFSSNARQQPQYHQVTLADITQIFERLQAAQGPAGNDEQLAHNPNNDPFLQFIRQLQMASQNNPTRQRNSGVNPQLIDRLPTFKYANARNANARNANATNEEDKERDDGDIDIDNDMDDDNKSCRICLEYYEHGQELRFLPCFHKYHKECVDRWFQMSSKCPICKTSITQQLRQ